MHLHEPTERGAAELVELLQLLDATDEGTLDRGDRSEGGSRRAAARRLRRLTGAEPVAAVAAEAHLRRVLRAAALAADRRQDPGGRGAHHLEGLADRVPHHRGVGEAVVPILLERPDADLGERIGDPPVGSDLPWIGDGVVDVPEHDLRRRLVVEGELVGEQLEEHHTEGVDVTASVDLLSARLLGRHVVGGAADQPRSGDRGRVVADDGRETEVDDLDQVVAGVEPPEDDVLRLHVPVNDVERVRFVERLEDADQQLADPWEGQWPLLVHDEGEVLALQELHREIEDPVVGATEVDDADAVRVVQPAGGASLAVEASDRLLVAEQVRVDDLDRDGAAQRALLRAVHATHATDAHQLLNEVVPPDGPTHQGVVGARRAIDGGSARAAELVTVSGNGATLMAESHARSLP